jgi:hypothetical protein
MKAYIFTCKYNQKHIYIFTNNIFYRYKSTNTIKKHIHKKIFIFSQTIFIHIQSKHIHILENNENDTQFTYKYNKKYIHVFTNNENNKNNTYKYNTQNDTFIGIQVQIQSKAYS